MKKTIYSALLVFSVLFTSCNFLDVTPIGQVVPQYTEEFRGLMTAAYSKVPSYKRVVTVRTDELNAPNEFAWSYDTYFDLCTWNDVNPNPKAWGYPYDQFYNVIFYTNHVIAEENNIKADGSELTAQVVAEAYALRAYSHFLLVNIFAQPYSQETAESKAIPLSLDTDLDKEFPRAMLSEVYASILSDIAEAESRMTVSAQVAPNNYRFSKESLLALKARVALYMKDWNQALRSAKEVIDMHPALEDMNDASAKAPYHFESKEAILALVPMVDIDIQDDMALSKELVALYNQDNDKRFKLYFRSSYGSFKVNKGAKSYDKTEFRASELYLIAAEAAAQSGKADEAKSYLLALTSKRLTPEFFATESERVNALSGDALLAEIADERQRELAVEGHRWFDLRRTTRQQIIKTDGFNEYKLEANDSRYTIRFPKSAIANNPLLRD